jgi:hypothetical protein
MKKIFDLPGLWRRYSAVTSLRKGQKILGKENIFSVKGVTDKIPYEIETLMWARAQNESGEEYGLFYKKGPPLEGVRREYPKEFCPALIWEKRPDWITQASKPGYLLVNRKPVSVVHWTAGDPKHPLIPVRMATIAEISITLRQHGYASPLEKKYHCGLEVNGIVPMIGGHDRAGMLVTAIPAVIVAHLACEQPCELGVFMCHLPEVKVEKK